MPSRVLAYGRAACAWALVAAAIGGCTSRGAGSSTVTVSGTTLTVYVSDAPSAQRQVAADVLAAEQLAFRQSPARVGNFTLRLRVLRHGISDNARQAIQDKSAIAYLGEIVPHSSYASFGITNALALLEVSPTDTALELTQATPAVPGAPDRYYQSLGTYGRTFARVVPTSAREAKAQVQEMQALGVRKLYVGDDGGPYGAAMANALKHDAAGGMTVVSSPAAADGLFYATTSAARAASAFNSAAASNPSLKLFAPSALDDPGFAARLAPAVRNLYVSSPGFLKADLSAAGSKFVTDFTAAEGHAPDVQAIFGYEAMAAVLAALRQAGANANNRSTVVRDFQSLKRTDSVLGSYSMNGSGDTSLGAFVFSRLKRGQLVPVTFVSLQG